MHEGHSLWGITRAERQEKQERRERRGPATKANGPRVAGSGEIEHVQPATRVCKRCLAELPIEAFSRHATGKGWRHTCNVCRREQGKAYSKRFADRRSDAARLRNYGISPDTYRDMFARQGGLCAICKQSETMLGGRHGSTPVRLAVDHDHATGAVRGLLCSSCNQGIGYFKHDTQLLSAAIEYLSGL